MWYKRHYLVPLHGVSTAVLPLLKFQPTYFSRSTNIGQLHCASNYTTVNTKKEANIQNTFSVVIGNSCSIVHTRPLMSQPVTPTNKQANHNNSIDLMFLLFTAKGLANSDISLTECNSGTIQKLTLCSSSTLEPVSLCPGCTSALGLLYSPKHSIQHRLNNPVPLIKRQRSLTGAVLIFWFDNQLPKNVTALTSQRLAAADVMHYTFASLSDVL